MSLKHMLTGLCLSVFLAAAMTPGANAMALVDQGSNVTPMASIPHAHLASKANTIAGLPGSRSLLLAQSTGDHQIAAGGNSNVKADTQGVTDTGSSFIGRWLSSARALAGRFLTQLVAILPVLWTPFRIAAMLVLLFAYTAYYRCRIQRETLEREQAANAPEPEFGPEGEGDIDVTNASKGG